ncbi:MAG: SDR family oxidoreductase [Candidatus Nucleicultricaceae bacterium]
MGNLAGKTIFITGGSRGIGREIALRAARDGANIAIFAKTAEPHPKLAGTIFSVAEEIEQAGGKALPIQGDIRDEVQLAEAAKKTVETFGSLDILINNASAIQLTGTSSTEMKRFDLMFDVNVRGTFAATQACLPYLKKGKNPHVLMLSPPLNMNPHWFENHCAYTMSKYGMSMCVLGMSEEFKPLGIAVNALWPRTAIATAAIELLGGEAFLKSSRSPKIVADAAYLILTSPSATTTGNFFIDEEILIKSGKTNFDEYAPSPDAVLFPDFFLD